MSHIRIIPHKEAEGELKGVLDEMIQPPATRLPMVLQCMSLNPAALQAVSRLNNTVTFGASTLTRAKEEMIATLVSVINGCDY